MHPMGGCVRVPEGGAQFVDFSEAVDRLQEIQDFY